MGSEHRRALVCSLVEAVNFRQKKLPNTSGCPSGFAGAPERLLETLLNGCNPCFCRWSSCSVWV